MIFRGLEDAEGEKEIDLEGIMEDMRMGKSVRESPGEEDGGEGSSNLLDAYVRGLTEKCPQHPNQEFRTALTLEAVRLWRRICSSCEGKAHGEEEVFHQLLRAWEDVQVYCYDHHLSCPDLLCLVQEARTIPEELHQPSLLYLQTYLQTAGWRMARGEREVEETWETHSDVRELLARPLITSAECMMVLPPPLRDFLTEWVREHRRLPRREEVTAYCRERGEREEECGAHEEWLADRHTEAKNLLVLANMRLVVVKAGQYQEKGGEVPDLIQEAAMGLMDAAERFEPHHGSAFTTYAKEWMFRNMRLYVQKMRHTICQNPNVAAEVREFQECVRVLQGTLGRCPVEGEVQEALGWKVEKFQRVQQASEQRVVSLNTPLCGADEEGVLEDTVEDPHCRGGTLEWGYHFLLHDLLMEVLKGLPKREREIVILRHGLQGGPPYTLQQAAEILQLTRQRAHQLESCGEARLIRIIAKRFPHLLPDGMTPELAMVLANQRDWCKAKREKKRVKKEAIHEQRAMSEYDPPHPLQGIVAGLLQRAEEIDPETVRLSRSRLVRVLGEAVQDGMRQECFDRFVRETLLLERLLQWAFLHNIGLTASYHEVLRQLATEHIRRGKDFEEVKGILQEKIDILKARNERMSVYHE